VLQVPEGVNRDVVIDSDSSMAAKKSRRASGGSGGARLGSGNAALVNGEP